MKQPPGTLQRQLVLDAVKARSDHPSADQIYLDVRAVNDRISRSTVYRNLNVLVRMGMLHRVKLPDSDRYEYRPDKHYHLFCLGCGAVSDAPLDYPDELDEEMAIETGYSIERHRVVFEGLCPDCQKR